MSDNLSFQLQSYWVEEVENDKYSIMKEKLLNATLTTIHNEQKKVNSSMNLALKYSIIFFYEWISNG